jgi:hypothetical protein
VVDPRGEVVVETTDRVALATIDAAAVLGSRKRYPGYLPIRARLYGDAWTEIGGRDG